MKPEDFKNTKPSLLIEEYFDGKVKAWGILQDRSGKVTRQFKADLVGSFKDNVITLDEDFYWTDGEKQKRTWKIKKVDDNNYVGTAPDVVGEATGVQYGSAFKFKYDLMVPFKIKISKFHLMTGYSNKTKKLQLIVQRLLNLDLKSENLPYFL